MDKLPRAAKSWKFVFFNWGFRRDIRPVDYHCRAPASEQLTAGAVAAEQLTAGAGQQDGHVDKLPRAAKSWKFVFLNWGFRRDVRPRGLSLQGTIPSLSAMVFSRPGGAFFEAICWLANSCKQICNKVAAEQPRQQGWKQRICVSSRAAYSRSRAAGRPCGQAQKKFVFF